MLTVIKIRTVRGPARVPVTIKFELQILAAIAEATRNGPITKTRLRELIKEVSGGQGAESTSIINFLRDNPELEGKIIDARNGKVVAIPQAPLSRKDVEALAQAETTLLQSRRETSFNFQDDIKFLDVQRKRRCTRMYSHIKNIGQKWMRILFGEEKIKPTIPLRQRNRIIEALCSKDCDLDQTMNWIEGKFKSKPFEVVSTIISNALHQEANQRPGSGWALRAPRSAFWNNLTALTQRLR